MSQDEAWKAVACECPRRIIWFLHQAGVYLHGTSARFPGKILCFHKDSELPADWEPTEAQVAAWEAAAQAQSQARQA